MTSEPRPLVVPRRVIVAALVIVVMLAAITVVVLAMNLLGGLARPGVGPSGSAAPSASPSAEQPTASVTPEASLEQTSEPTPQPKGPDFIARVTVNDLNLRAEPSTSANSFGHLSVGDRVFVLQGPEESAGFGWYRVAIVDEALLPGPDSVCGDTCLTARIGWVAGIGDRDQAWLVPAEVTCPPNPDLAALAGLEPLERLACYGDQTLTVEGVVWRPCCGYVGAFLYEPDWLSWPSYGAYLQPTGKPLTNVGGFGIRLDPAAGLAWPEYADIIRVTGRMDNPAASTCTIVVDEAASQQDPSLEVDPGQLAYAPIGCRAEFVVVSMEILGNTGETCGC